MPNGMLMNVMRRNDDAIKNNCRYLNKNYKGWQSSLIFINKKTNEILYNTITRRFHIFPGIL